MIPEQNKVVHVLLLQDLIYIIVNHSMIFILIYSISDCAHITYLRQITWQ